MSLSAPTLFDILLRLYDELGELRYGIATGGSSTTLVDSGLGGSDDDWNQGAVFVVEADAAAPEGEYAEVTDYTSLTGTLKFSSSGIDGISAAPAADDEYALARSTYTLDSMRGIVNRGLSKILLLDTDESLSTSANRKEYTLPAVARQSMRRVWLSQVSTANNEGWQEMTTWYSQNGILIFRQQPEIGKTIKLGYMTPHTRLAANSDTLDPDVTLERAIAEAFYLATVSKIRRTKGGGPALKRQLEDARKDLDMARRRFPVWDPGKPFKPILSGRKGRLQRRRAAYGPWITQ